MRVLFDKNLQVAGIGLVPWTRLGPERWLENYKIASLYNWDINVADVPGVPAVHALTDIDKGVQLDKLNTQSMLNNGTFRSMLRDDFAGYSLLTYKPVAIPAELEAAGVKFLASSRELAKKLENKAYFRELFSPKGIPFPEYEIIDMANAEASDQFLTRVLKGEEDAILQDADLSGGKGTFVVNDLRSLEHTLTSIERLGASGRLVASKRISGARERTVQGVVTQYGVFIGPLQKQIIADPLLSNLSIPDGDKFCGAEISTDDPIGSVYEEIKSYAMTIGGELQTLGYKGIFGIDCLVDETNQVYVLEINPRITGVTPLLTALYRDGDIPFYLLHILELAEAGYEIEDIDTTQAVREGSLLMLHSQSEATSTIVDSPHSGLYDENLNFIKSALRFDDTDKKQVLIQRYSPPVFKVKPGGRLLSVFINDTVMNESDQLKPEVKKLITNLLNMVKLEEV